MLSRASLLLCAKRPVGSSVLRAIYGDNAPQDACNKIERRKRPEFPGKVRLGFVPEEWFQFLYPKTGVTGPYALGVCVLTYICSKEIYVMEHEYYSGLSIAIMVVLGVKKLGPGIRKWADREIDIIENAWGAGRKEDLKELTDAIANEKKEQWRAEGALMLMEAKKECVALQLECAYREHTMQAYNEVKRRLDYHVHIEEFRRQLAHKQMIKWVESNVRSSINPELEKNAFDKCILDLAALAARVK